jgi:very-short-patch-repair endonuclease
LVVHVTLLRGARPVTNPTARVHWTRRLPHEDIDRGITTPLRTVLDCAASMPFPEALAVADSAVAQRFVRPEALVTAAAALRGPQRARCLRVAGLADHRAENPFESVLRATVLEAGVTGFEPQVRIELPRRVHFADLADVRRRLVLEADSFAHHGSRAALMRDCDRDNDLVAAGWTVLRFSWEHVMLRPQTVAAVVSETCARLDVRRR